MEQGNGLYLYGVIAEKERKDFEVKGINGAEVFALPYKDVAAVVSVSPLVIYDPDEANTLVHASVVNTVFRDYTFLPMSFGVILKGEDDVIRLLTSAHSEFMDALRRLAGKVEVGLKLIWRKESFSKEMAQLARSRPEVNVLKIAVDRTGGDDYMSAIKLGDHVKTFLEERRRELTASVIGQLRPYLVTFKENESIGNRMICNLAMLVDRDDLAELDSAVEKVMASLCAETEFRYTGPWPPYNFVDIHLVLNPEQ